MATLYYNAAVDTDWNTLGNWWLNSGHTTPATSLPTSSDSVVASASIGSNSGSEPTLVDVTLNGSGSLDISITFTGSATFNDSAGYDLAGVGATLTGNATFNDSTVNNGIVNGNATFNDSSYNNSVGSVGAATFNANSLNYGSVGGAATFDGSSVNLGTVGGNATFTGNAVNKSGVSGDLILAYEKGINGSSILGVV